MMASPQSLLWEQTLGGDGLLADERARLSREMEHKPFTSGLLHPLDTMALSTMAIPGLGDVMGLAADARRYIQEPESRTAGNYFLTGLGALPFIPPALHTVYHGSPHRFAKFSSSKIGTGEGNQAFGHGLYFAESPGVAQTYKSPGRFVGESEGHLYQVDIPDEAVARMLDWDKPLEQQPLSVQKALRDAGIVNPQGNVYWLPGKEATGEAMYDAISARLMGDKIGEPREMHKQMAAMQVGDQPGASELLRSIGIPGVRYLDEGSRLAGEGTRNLVLFDDSLATILEMME